MAYSKPSEVIIIQKFSTTLPQRRQFSVFRKGTVPPAGLAGLSGGLPPKNTCAFYFI